MQQAAISTAVRLGGPECLVPLFRQSRRRIGVLRAEAHDAIVTILPTIGSSWYGKLTSEVIHVLVLLAGSSEEPLAMAAMDALEKAGDGSAAAPIHRLAHRMKQGSARERAEALEQLLLTRKLKEAEPGLLLRPSDAESIKDLVRPVYGSHVEGDELVRSTSANHATISLERSGN